jgi:hypothetical protein
MNEPTQCDPTLDIGRRRHQRTKSPERSRTSSPPEVQCIRPRNIRAVIKEGNGAATARAAIQCRNLSALIAPADIERSPKSNSACVAEKVIGRSALYTSFNT